ncbi:MAG TPA: polyisoprenoid-binding protein [Bacteroidetes bacterium]|nr:polyisoprenoid-binding protein [Bacteroidota bacterium]
MKHLLSFFAFSLLLSMAGAASASTWTFDDPHTNIRFRTKHLMVVDVWGKFNTFSGTITYDPKDITKSKVDVTIDVASVDTDNEKRDNHLRSADFFDAENYPKMTFVSKKIEKAGAGKLKIIGDLTIRGVTREVTLDVDGPTGPFGFMKMNKMAAHATTVINRMDYGVNWNMPLAKGGLLVSEDVDIVIDAELNEMK